MSKFDFKRSSKRLIVYYSKTIKIKRFQGIVKPSEDNSFMPRKIMSDSFTEIDCTISNYNPIHKSKLSFDINAYTQLLKIKTLDKDVRMGDIFLINDKEYETIEITEYNNIHALSLKIIVGLKRGSA